MDFRPYVIPWPLLIFKFLAQGEDSSQCPKGWVYYGESCYLLHFKDKFNWPESQVFCSGYGAHLVHIGDATENTYIKGSIALAFNSTDPKANVWLGATDYAYEGQFLWYGTGKSLTFTDWYPGEPNSSHEDCLVFWSRYHWKWADYDCHAQCYFVCEKS